jgi:hypothetical protein
MTKIFPLHGVARASQPSPRVLGRKFCLSVTRRGLPILATGAFTKEFFPLSACLEEPGKENQLAVASDGSLIIPLGMEASAGGGTG